MERSAKQMADLLKPLANENRLRIICALLKGAKTVGEIGKQVSGISAPALSQHLAVLKAHGILSCEKCGMNNLYAIADGRALEIMRVLGKYYCEKNCEDEKNDEDEAQ